ncbi:MAG: hypothetical protein ACOZNI_14580 [Myxococcota bacterium]
MLLRVLTACFTTSETPSDAVLHDAPPAGWEDEEDDTSTTGGGDDTADTPTGEDGDGDGWDADEDCDDDDDDVNPGVDEDMCDGVDEDCDGYLDEDFVGDDFEENDADGGSDLGELTDAEEVAIAYLNPEEDVDVFLFYVYDSYWDWFGVLGDLEVPGGVDLVMELHFYPDDGNEWEEVMTVDDGGEGRDELLEWGGSGTDDNSGWYAILVWSASGYSCESAYTLQIGA